ANWSTLPASRSSNPHHNKSAPERKGRKMTTKKADYIWFNGEMVPCGEGYVVLFYHGLQFGTWVFVGMR
ncbi:hypothetical protein, partial [Pseudomonas aeruginosa]|uniref:hypothetical protein n=1 Tax=Pseudomonas aeruginosa TaxID=287 RepID=UPI003BF570AC